MADSSETIEFEFKTPEKSEFFSLFLRYALMPYILLLVLIPAYIQIKSWIVFSPLIVISLFQLFLFFYLKNHFKLHINKVIIDKEKQSLQLVILKQGHTSEVILPFKSFNLIITKRPNYTRSFSYFELYNKDSGKRILKQNFIGEWHDDILQSILGEYALRTRVSQYKLHGV